VAKEIITQCIVNGITQAWLFKNKYYCFKCACNISHALGESAEVEITEAPVFPLLSERCSLCNTELK
jgi:hypothetical protein